MNLEIKTNYILIDWNFSFAFQSHIETNKGEEDDDDDGDDDEMLR